MASWLLLVVGSLSVWATVVALVRVRPPWALGFSVMLTSWLTGEWPMFHLILQVAVGSTLVAAGGLDAAVGVVGFALLAASCAGLVVVRIVHARAAPSAHRVLQAALGDDYLDRIADRVPDGASSPASSPVSGRFSERGAGRRRPGRHRSGLPFLNDATGIVRIDDVAYGEHPHRHRLDVYRPDTIAGPRPVVIQVHGGGWVTGHKRQQAMPLLHHLVHQGYVTVSINYRLGPRWRFPDQLVDVKRAIAWTRDHIADHGGDPTKLIITGGSAGGHLSALAALTPNDPRFQPGFEQADTSVLACIPFYGPMDLVEGSGVAHRAANLRGYLRRTVMPGSFSEIPDLYRAMSPITHVHPGAPPFFIIQGTIDVLVWREGNRRFARRLADVSAAPVVHWEVPGAQHAFDTWHSRRSAAAIEACERFIAWVAERSTG